MKKRKNKAKENSCLKTICRGIWFSKENALFLNVHNTLRIEVWKKYITFEAEIVQDLKKWIQTYTCVCEIWIAFGRAVKQESHKNLINRNRIRNLTEISQESDKKSGRSLEESDKKSIRNLIGFWQKSDKKSDRIWEEIW